MKLKESPLLWTDFQLISSSFQWRRPSNDAEISKCSLFLRDGAKPQVAGQENAASPHHITNEHIFQLGGHTDNSRTSPWGQFTGLLPNSGPALAVTVRQPVFPGHVVSPADDVSQRLQWDNSPHPTHYEPDTTQTDYLLYTSPVSWTPSSTSPHSASTQASSTAWTLPSASSGSHAGAFASFPASHQNIPPALHTSLGLDCPIGCHRRSECPWKSDDGLADNNRVREHVGKRHGLLCQDCQFGFRTQTDFQKHRRRKDADGKCPKGDGEPRHAFTHPVDLPPAIIIEFYTAPKKLKSSPEEEWYAGYGILNPDWQKAAQAPSPYYRENLTKHNPPELEANSATSLSTTSKSSSSGTDSSLDETSLPSSISDLAGSSANAFNHEGTHLHTSDRPLNSSTHWPILEMPSKSVWDADMFVGDASGYNQSGTDPPGTSNTALADNMAQTSPLARFTEQSILHGLPKGAMIPLSRRCSQSKALVIKPSSASVAPGSRPTTNDATLEPTIPEVKRNLKRSASASSNNPSAKRQALESVDELDKLRDKIEILKSKLNKAGGKNHRLEDERRQLVDALRQIREEFYLWGLCNDGTAAPQFSVDVLNEIIQRIQHLLE